MDACALAQLHQLSSRQQLVCFQLDVDLSYLTDCGWYEVTGHVRSFCQVSKVPGYRHIMAGMGTCRLTDLRISR